MFKKIYFSALLLISLCLTMPASARASLPNTIQDTSIGDGTAASCQTSDAANTLSNAVLAGGVITFNCGPAVVTIEANTNATDQVVTVDGGGKIILSGANFRQIFYLYGNANLTLKNISLAYGDSGSGGAMYVGAQAHATIYNSFLYSNHASSSGGAIINYGTLTISHSTLGSNLADADGGAIYNDGGSLSLQGTYLINNHAMNGGGINLLNGTLLVITSAFRSNSVTGIGAGVRIENGTAQFENSTFSNNQANQGGGVYKTNGTATLINLTFNENRADLGGAFHNFGGQTTTHNSIFTGSLDEAGTGPSLNCDGSSMNSTGHNLISDNSCLPQPGSSGDLFSTDPLLGVWEVPEHVYTPQPGSPALDYGIDCPAIDQLGKSRPFGPACDAGSAERGWWVYLPVLVR
jgi:hypothetical protein